MIPVRSENRSSSAQAKGQPLMIVAVTTQAPIGIGHANDVPVQCPHVENLADKFRLSLKAPHVSGSKLAEPPHI
jgi:hypothetical protein